MNTGLQLSQVSFFHGKLLLVKCVRNGKSNEFSGPQSREIPPFGKGISIKFFHFQFLARGGAFFSVNKFLISGLLQTGGRTWAHGMLALFWTVFFNYENANKLGILSWFVMNIPIRKNFFRNRPLSLIVRYQTTELIGSYDENIKKV